MEITSIFHNFISINCYKTNEKNNSLYCEKHDIINNIGINGGKYDKSKRAI